jgi:hypothetical protein
LVSMVLFRPRAGEAFVCLRAAISLSSQRSQITVRDIHRRKPLAPLGRATTRFVSSHREAKLLSNSERHASARRSRKWHVRCCVQHLAAKVSDSFPRGKTKGIANVAGLNESDLPIPKRPIPTRHPFASPEDPATRVWDAASGRDLAALRPSAGQITRGHFSPDGSSVITVSSDSTVTFWPLPTRQGLIDEFCGTPDRDGTLGRHSSPEWQELSAATRDSYRRVLDPEAGYLRRAIPLTLDRIELETLSTPNVVRLRNKVSKRFGYWTANNTVGVLRTLFRWGVLYGHMETNPAAGVPALKRPEGLSVQHRSWAADEFNA